MSNATQQSPQAGNGKMVQATQQKSEVQILREHIDKSKAQLMAALPPGLITADRLARCVLTEFQRNPFLLGCDPISIVGCMIQAGQLGLEIGGALGQAYMVPFNNRKMNKKEAQFQIGYRGLIALAHRSNQISSFFAQIVHANDNFRMRYGTDAGIDHEPNMGDRGEPTGVYAVVKFRHGGSDFEFMNWTEIQQHRGKYSKAYAGSPWDTAPEEMAKKTVMRRLAKRIPMSVELMRAAVLDEYGETGVDQGMRIIVDNNEHKPADPLLDSLGVGQQEPDHLLGEGDKPKEQPQQQNESDMTEWANDPKKDAARK